MSLTLSCKCPHCETERAGFTYVGTAEYPNASQYWHVFFQCNTCFGPVVALARIVTGDHPQKMSGNIAQHGSIICQQIFPNIAPPSAPAHCPDAIARAFIQAESSIKRGHWESAAAMDRRALEIATKEMAPDHADMTLYKRIEKLAETRKLTESLKNWAHDLRSVGNDAVHEVDGVDEKEAIQAHELTRFILIYLYTLPAQVEQARAARENGK